MQNECKCGCKGIIGADDKRFVELKEFIASLEGTQGITMPVLQEAQRIFGYLPLEVQKFISQETGVPIAELYGVSTFYSQFYLTPQGRHRIGVCLGTACYVRGSQALLDSVANALNIKVGDTTPDQKFTLEATRCLGCCGLAPVMMIDDDVYTQPASEEALAEILAKYE